MLPHYSPVKVAETFSILAALGAGRIDLGLGRAPGTDGLTALALQRDRRQPAPDDFPSSSWSCSPCSRTTCPPTIPSRAWRACCRRPGGAAVGSSPQSAIWAAELGLPYSFADFIQPEGAGIAANYRSRFIESGRASRPTVSVGVVAVCAETDEEADRGGQPPHGVLHAEAGSPDQGPTGGPGGPLLGEPRPRRRRGRRLIVGSPVTVRSGIEEVAAEYGAEEVVS